MIAEVFLSCGRHFLSVAGIVVACEGDPCRECLPDDIAEPIPDDELISSWIGEHKAADLPKAVVRFFRGEKWTPRSLRWAADKINAEAK